MSCNRFPSLGNSFAVLSSFGPSFGGMKVKKLSLSTEQSRVASSDDILAWSQYSALNKRKTSAPALSSEASVPVGLVGVGGDDMIDLLFADDAQKKLEHRELSSVVPDWETSPDAAPIAPPFKSKGRFQAIAAADVASWNREGSSGPLGLIGLVPDAAIEKLFDEQTEDLQKRNAEIAQLLKQQREELEFSLVEKMSEAKLAKEEKRLQRANSLMLNKQICNAYRTFAQESAMELSEAQEQIRLLRQEIKILAREKAERGLLAIEMLTCEDSSAKCLICKYDRRTHIFIPCGHFSSCFNCNDLEQVCPTCHERPTGVQKRSDK